MTYIGRFAPSPSGELHFGSLVTAVGSYLQAKAAQGEWLVRIEDIDPPREKAGAAKTILETLERFGLYWDRDILYQSQRADRYRDTLQHLLKHQQAYYCDCSRQRLHSLKGHYDGHCRARALSRQHHLAIRFRQCDPVYQFEDQLLGQQQVNRQLAQEDFIIHRRDNLFAYNLAVVLDDNDQGVTEIVRGADLLPVTAKQLSLYQALAYPMPTYCHLPLAINCQGDKLSKQNHAPPITHSDPLTTLANVLSFLGQRLPDDWPDARIEELLHYSIQHWDRQKMAKHAICVETKYS